MGYHHSHAFVCCDEFPSTSYDLLSSHVHSNSDLECASVKANIHIEASFAPHLPVCLMIHSASTCVGDTPCSLAYSSYELSPRLTQGNGVFHDEKSLNTHEYSHSSSSCVLHEGSSSSQLAENFDEACDRDGCHPKRSFEINSNNHPQAMHDLVHISKCNFSILESSKTCQGVNARQHPLMVMSRPRDSSKPVKPNQILFLTHNPSICMVSLDVDPRVKNIYYSGCDISKFHIFANDRIHESITPCLYSFTSLTSNSGWECSSLMQSWDKKVDHLKEYLYLESYLLDVLYHNQLLGLFANFSHQICPLITPTISLCDDECTTYCTNQVILISPHPNWFHTFTVLASFLHFYDDHDAYALFHQL